MIRGGGGGYLISNCGLGNKRVKEFDRDDGYKLCEAKHIYSTVMNDTIRPTTTNIMNANEISAVFILFVMYKIEGPPVIFEN